MACKFNSGEGAHTCDRCYVMMCVGTIPRPRYIWSNTHGPHQHYLLVRKEYKQSPESAYLCWLNQEDHEYGWLHEQELCKECAVQWEIDNEDRLLTVEHVYKIPRTKENS